MYGHKDAEIILMPIIFNGHYHLLMLDLENEKYKHYPSLEPFVYNSDVVDMLSPSLTLNISHFIYLLLMMRYDASVGSL